MTSRSFTFVAAFACASWIAVPAMAQMPRTTVSGGYQFINVSSSASDGGESLGAGWYADVSGHLTRTFAAAFQVGANYKTINESITENGTSFGVKADISIYQFLGGVRATPFPPNAVVKPFVHALAGATRVSGSGEASLAGGGINVSASSSSSITKPAMQLGGGVDFMLTEGIGVRAGADYARVFNVSDTDGGLNIFRFAVGAVIPF